MNTVRNGRSARRLGGSRRRGWRRWWVPLLWGAVLSALAAVALGVWFWKDYRDFLDEPLTVPAGGVVYEVRPGMSVRAVARDLERRGLIRQPLYLDVYARVSGLAGRIQAGEYRITPGLTPVALLEMLTSGRILQARLTIPEGWTFRQMLTAVQAHPKIRVVIEPGQNVMALLGEPDMKPEGWFFPDTYHFPKGTTDLEFLRRAHREMRRRLSEAWRSRAEGLPLKSAYEALILASIVEKETSRKEEYPLVAAVFVRRLERGMKLQTDPTVIYGLGERFDGNLRRRDLREDTPFNTYVHKGLPPTPISLPGEDALRAATRPADVPYLYFVAKGDGTHYFSKTYDEHRKAVRQYQLKR